MLIRPTAPLADRAVLPADPGVALALAQALLDTPRMFNHNHGLWGYTGLAADGAQLTIQSTGVGGPSAAIVLDELIGLGLRRAVRVGTCSVARSSDAATCGPPEPRLGDLVIAERAVCGDGTSRALGGGAVVDADSGLTRALGLASPATRRGLVASADIVPGLGLGLGLGLGVGAGAGAGGAATESGGTRTVADGATERGGRAATRPAADDMEAAALLRLGAMRGAAVACVLVVAALMVDGRAERIEDGALASACERAGRLALSGLAARPDW
jgi:uridine phosphorylase